MNTTLSNPVVSRSEWIEARKALLIKEKEQTRRRDQLASERRNLPWVKVDKEYIFDTPQGKKSLSELFRNKSQLIVYHFMLGPGWAEGCVGCSFGADHYSAALQHLLQKDVNFVAVSRATLPEIESYKKRMGWNFQWVSSNQNDFNYDFHVSASDEDKNRGNMYYNFQSQPFVMDELPGISVFYKNEDGEIFHTYSSYGRGGEEMLGTYFFLDLTPKGREETKGDMSEWVRRHDEYDAIAEEKSCCH